MPAGTIGVLSCLAVWNQATTQSLSEWQHQQHEASHKRIFSSSASLLAHTLFMYVGSMHGIYSHWI